MRFHVRSLTLLALVLLASCKQDAPPQDTAAADSGQGPQPTIVFGPLVAPVHPWDAFIEEQVEAYLQAHPAWAVMQGRHEFDGLLPDWSQAGIKAEIARLYAAREAAMEFDRNKMSKEQHFQQEYFIARMDHDLFWASTARWPFRNPQFYIGWMNDSLDPAPYLTLDYAPPEERMKAFIRYLNSVTIAAGQIRENLAMPMPLTWLQLGVDAFSGYADYFRNDVPAIWSGVGDAQLQAMFAQANEQAIDAMGELAAWLESNRASATDDFALGPDLFRQMLWDTERVDISIEELEAVGRADMQRNLDALQVACEEFAPGADVRECFARMAARKPAKGPVLGARAQLTELRRFLDEQQLITIPGAEVALVNEAPPYARSNSAYINIPGPWEENQPSVYYISPPNPDWSEAVQANYLPGESDLLFTSVHEVWPGHFLNFLHANRAEWLFGRAFVGYAFGEGWAHYTEEMMLEAGLRGADAETRIGQLSNALLRNARFISAIGLHARGWSVEQSKQFFMEEGFQSEGTAIQQAARGTYDPAYLNYNMGKLLILKLRQDWTAQRGGREAWKQFHDLFLSYGGPPIPLVRQVMLGEPQARAIFPGVSDFVTGVANSGPAPGALQTLAWQCGASGSVVTQVEKDNVWLFLPGITLHLPRVESASGEKYSADGASFWTKGEEATIESSDGAIQCIVDHQATPWEDAKLRGADFRAVGNEPGWYLELFSDSASKLVSAYGEDVYSFTASEPRPLESETGTVFTGKSESVDITVTLNPGPCMDSMAEIEYETVVSVRLGEQLLIGCGMALH